MGQVIVRGWMIWSNHIKDDPALVARIEALRVGQTVELVVRGVGESVRGVWERCAGVGKPAAIRPVDSASKSNWRIQFEAHRGKEVDVRLVDAPAERWNDPPDAEREAAWEAFKALTRAGWSSEASDGSDRHDLHER